MRRTVILVLVLGVSGCGAEVAGTAAKVKEAEQVRKQREQVKQWLDAAAELVRQRRAAAEQRGYPASRGFDLVILASPGSAGKVECPHFCPKECGALFPRLSEVIRRRGDLIR
jgi:hypothetical protein